MIDLQPKICNLCGGKVVYTSNAAVYGREYGSGRCYLCKVCGAYVGTHKPRRTEALGILANEQMRQAKMICHEAFDVLWKGKKKEQKKRSAAYRLLSEKLGIPLEECHFGYFNMEMLHKAYKVVVAIKQEEGTC